MYYGQFKLDKVLHEKYFSDKRDGFFVEAGALDGHLESTCRFFEESLGWTGMNIEPTPPLFAMLENNRPKCKNVNVALSDSNNVKTFTHVLHPQLGTRFGNGSLTHDPKHKRDLTREGCTFEEYEVQCNRFSDIFDADREIDLFVLDVEGHEFEALKGIVTLDKKYLPRVFCIEHSFTGLDNISRILGSNYKLDTVEKHNAIYVKV